MFQPRREAREVLAGRGLVCQSASRFGDEIRVAGGDVAPERAVAAFGDVVQADEIAEIVDLPGESGIVAVAPFDRAQPFGEHDKLTTVPWIEVASSGSRKLLARPIARQLPIQLSVIRPASMRISRAVRLHIQRGLDLAFRLVR